MPLNVFVSEHGFMLHAIVHATLLMQFQEVYLLLASKRMLE